ncbi:hypothetical protein [Dethiothermospora halolimnae]|uniref:hypothetical protein n=1 Tax=Dethiothermospora halolimnae TaxID=3114390 RepID=UPI003CCB7A39
MRYILNAGEKLTKEDANEIIEEIEATYPEGRKVVMTLAEKFREEGIIMGMEKGETRGEKKLL